MHALEETKQWVTEGRSTPRHVNPWGAFLQLWANLGRYHPEYDHNDQKRFWAAFMVGFSGEPLRCEHCGLTPAESGFGCAGRPQQTKQTPVHNFVKSCDTPSCKEVTA